MGCPRYVYQQHIKSSILMLSGYIADLRLDIGPLAKVLAAQSLYALYRVTAIGGTHPADTAYMYD